MMKRRRRRWKAGRRRKNEMMKRQRDGVSNGRERLTGGMNQRRQIRRIPRGILNAKIVIG